MKKLTVWLLALVLTVLTACGKTEEPAFTPEDEEPIDGSFSMATGDVQGTYYAVGSSLAGLLAKETQGKIAVQVVPTGGSKDNLEKVALGLHQLAAVQSDVMSYAYKGTNSFRESGAITNFRVLCGLYAETVQIITLDPEIQSVSDLEGKSVCVGDMGSGTYFNAVDILNAYDLGEVDKKGEFTKLRGVYESFSDSAEGLLAGEIDAAIITAGAPTPAVEKLAAEKEVCLLSIDDEHMTRLLEKCPHYDSYTVLAGTYGMESEVTTVTTKATLICSDTLTQEQAYAIVSAIFRSGSEIPALSDWNLTFATQGMAAPFHKGAAQFFAQQGIEVVSK